MKRTTTLIVMIVIALVIAAIGVFVLVKNINMQNNYDVVYAPVRLERTYETNGKTRTRSAYVTYNYKGVTYNNHQITYSSNMQDGDSVKLYVNPANPYEADVQQFGTFVILEVAALAMAGLGVLVFKKGKFND